ncbi:MAG: M23 family metallopeptidase [Clostridia bacterium]|nr:M23 family metallopeptidase [Clostridia bacterium]
MRNEWDWEDIKGAPLGWTGPERNLPPLKFPRLWLRQGLIATALFVAITLIFRLDGYAARQLQLGLSHYLTEPAADYTAAVTETVRSAMWLDAYDRWVYHTFNAGPETVPVSSMASLALPLSGTISRPYGPVIVDGQQYFHAGIDIVAPGGSGVQAALAGRVIRNAEDPLLGKVVEIDHGQGLVTVYGTLGQVQVDSGQVVARGELIATLAGGREAQLHFEVRQNGQAVDPAPLFTTGDKI